MKTQIRIFGLLVVVLILVMPGNPVRAQSPAAARRPAGAVPAYAEDTRTARLPVRRVVLYKNGIGYFEHVGRVRGDQEVTIDFTSAQLNDVLKSLTALDLGGGRVTGVSYNSDAPLARRLGALRLPLGERASLQQFLDALRGAKLEIRSGTTAFTGRLLSVERKTRVSGGTTLEVDHLSLVTDSGEMRTVELTPLLSVRLADRDLGSEVNRYLDLISSTRAQDLRRMAIATSGSGERPLFVSYISEVPVWKTTYRLVLPSKPGAKPLLQGWAIVDNTVGEDWSNVELSLVAGAPQSFIQQLSQPYYSRRPVVPLPEAAQLTPQTHQASFISGYGSLTGAVTDPTGAVIPGATVRAVDESGNTVAQTTTDYQGRYNMAALPAGDYKLEIERAGFNKNVYQNLALNGRESLNMNAQLQVGAVSNVVMVEAGTQAVESTVSEYATIGRNLGSGRSLGNRSGAGMASPSRITGGVVGGVVGTYNSAVGEARASGSSAAQAQELGDLFEYKLKEPVTIGKNQSAMVPIVHTEIGMEKVSLWNAGTGTRPWRAIWLTNTSALTLDGGTFNVLQDETFAGEGLMDPIKPGEKRLLSYALDYSTQVDTRRDSERQSIRRVRVSKGTMFSYGGELETKTYAVRNDDTTPRVVIIEHPVRPEWKLQPGSAVPVESSAGSYRFRVTVEPKKTEKLAVIESRSREYTFVLNNITEEQIEVFQRGKNIDAAIAAAFQKVVAQKAEIARLDAEIESREEARTEIFDDQQRLRENMKALKGSSEEKELLQRYTRQLNDQENRLETLKKETEQLQAQRAAEQARLDKMIQELSFDVTL